MTRCAAGSAHHLVTGATGFLGGALVLELLARTEATIWCVVRARPGKPAADRLNAALAAAAAAYGQQRLLRAAAARCQAVPGDVTEPLCGVNRAGLPAMSQVWHAAASLAYKDSRREEILQHNLGGTRQAMALARELGARCFNYISTAYVAGTRNGRIPATAVPAGTVSNNAYEDSKVRAENSVLAAGFTITRIFRPTIVIGHSETFAATSLNGFYALLDGFAALRDAARSQPAGRASRPLRIRGDADARGNLIPVDRVATAAVGVARADGESGFYHLANTEQSRNGDTMSVIARELAMETPVFTSDTAGFSRVEAIADRNLTFFRPYLSGTKEFDVANVARLVGSSVLSVPLGHERLVPYLDWYRRQREEK